MDKIEELERALHESRETNRALIMKGTAKPAEPEPTPEISQDDAFQWLVERKYHEVRDYLS